MKFRTSPAPPLGRAVSFDLENRPLAYWYDEKSTAEITAIGWKWDDEENVNTLMLLPDGYFRDDRDVRVPAALAYTIFRDVLCRAGLVYGHNIRSHDFGLFNSGLLRLHLPPLPVIRNTDTFRDYPKHKDMSASLENLCEVYGVPEKYKIKEKIRMSIVKWEDANRLTDSGIAGAYKRVTTDVLLQWGLRLELANLGLLKPAKMWVP